MDRSRMVSEFSLAEKRTPSTLSPAPALSSPCPFCAEHLAKNTQLRKREIELQLENEKVKEQCTRLEREREELINSKLLTYAEYQQREEMQSAWNRQDLEAELFEAKILIELLLLSKGMPNHPQLKQIDAEVLRQKNSELLLENLRLQEKVMVRDRIIQQRSLFPIYHYDSRVSTLRKAVVHWYRKAEQECQRMRVACRNLKLGITHEAQNMRQLMNEQLQISKTQLTHFLQSETAIKGGKEERKVCQKKGKSAKEGLGKGEIKKLR